ncbi:MAG: hypothetical protein HUU22_14310 [Phycisphaerae bacterium]|nr:hypothetical protein [Phycisphaerae bacterium]
MRWPPPPETLGAFAVRDVRDTPSVPDQGQRRWERRMRLESLEPGEHEIPAIGCLFVDQRPDRRPAGAGAAPDEPASATQAVEPREEQELSAGPLVIRVASVVGDDADPTHFRDIKGAVDVPLERAWAWALWALAAIVVLAGAFVALRARRRARAADTPPPPPPHVWALGELDRLAAEDLPGRGAYHEYYYRLSGIVRQYIERRFGLMAPERTTEEFLLEAGRDPSLRDEHRALLAPFLQACDLVKFARYEPSRSDAESAMQTARTFVAQTAPVETPASAACGSDQIGNRVG